jgi:hypothetical protein
VRRDFLVLVGKNLWQSAFKVFPWSSKGTFLYLPTISHREIESINPGVCPQIDGNQIQHGGYSGHLG